MRTPNTPTWWQPELSPVWWMVAALMGSHIASAIHGAEGYGMLTGDQRAVAGLVAMGVFMLFIGAMASLMTHGRSRVRS